MIFSESLFESEFKLETERKEMPEGPEARRIAEKLRAKVKGLLLLRIDLFRLGNLTKSNEYCDNHKELMSKWPHISNLFPATCLDVITRGKQIYFFFDNGLVFNSGLGIEGHWYLNEPGFYTDFALIFGTTMSTGLMTIHAESVHLYYDDKIRYGNFLITNTQQAIDKMMKEYGPDFLNVRYPQSDIHPQVRAALPQEFFIVPTIDKFWAEISMPRRNRMPLCTFVLIHQEYFSGVGNWIMNEVFYLARLHPCRVCGSITREEAERLFACIVHVISLGHETGGLTHGTFLDPDKQKGMYQVLVYKREGQTDPHGYPIVQIKLPCDRKGYIVEALQR
jgi:formamidopyrimidine-DNA glycosylase